MRRIGFIDNQQDATRFCDYLVSQRIHAKAEKDENQGTACYGIWVKEEQKVGDAKAALAQFQANPSDTKFDASKEADAVRRLEAEENAKRLKNIAKVSHRTGGGMASRSVPVTIAAIAVCVLTGLMTGFGNPSLRVDRLGRPVPTMESRVFDALTFMSQKDRRETDDAFATIRTGELWRVFTPAILHGNMGHLAMNMMGLFFLGSAIERLHGGRWLLVMLVSVAIFANLVQVFWPESNNGGPNAVGASGATYGLFGFFMVRPFFQPMYPVSLPPSFLLLGLGFLVAGVLMIVPSMANGAHVGGLVGGMIFAALIPTGEGPRRRA
jgi:GlpG protein